MADEVIMEQTVSLGRLTGIVFDVMSNDEIKMLCSINIKESNDLTNAQLGLPTMSSLCDTCGFTNIRDCDGHNGVIKLPRTIYHPFFVPEVVQILNKICPGCKAIKKDIRMKGSFISENSKTEMVEGAHILEAFGKNLTAIERKILKLCRSNMLFPTQGFLVNARKVRLSNLKKSLKTGKNSTKTSIQESCKYCARSANEWYPAMKFKITPRDILGKKCLSVIAEVDEKLPKKFQSKSLNDILPDDYWNFLTKVSQQTSNPNRIIVSPYQAFCLLKELDPGFINQFVSRRELLFLSYLPVTPNSYRLVESSHAFADGPLLSFDERTKAYRRLVDTSRKINELIQHQQLEPLATSYITSRVVDCLNVSKLCSSRSSERSSCISGLRWLKEVVLSKRSDNAFRMIMVGDPKLKLGEIGIPSDIAENLFVSEHVNAYNLKKLNMSCDLLLLKREELSTRSKGKLTPIHKPNQLKVGDLVCRPLEDGDVILVNRPPSVHQHSLIGLSVKILPTQFAVSINPLCCAPLFGDFDGDCLHGYVPQSIQSRIELKELVTLDHQLLNAQDGRSLISLTHDSLTAAHLLTAGRVLLNKYEMQQLEMLCPFSSPPPSVVKAPKLKTPAWTGEQLFSMLLPPSMKFATVSESVKVNKGEIMYSFGPSFWLQNTSASIFSSMFESYGSKALHFLHFAQEVLCEYLTIRGLSVSLRDIYLCLDRYSRKKMIDDVYYGLEEAEDACQVKQLLLEPEMAILLKNYHENTLTDTIGCTSGYEYALKTRSVSQTSISAFKDVYQDLQSVIYHYLNKDNSILAMIHAGSKGSLLKLVQQGACLGMQLSTSPLPFIVPHELSCASWNNQKALDCEACHDATGKWEQNSYAVVKSSFLDGLNPLQCLVHSISGRSNLFSENAELPGTLTRKLMFYMRDLYAAYDGTVRNAYGQRIVQFSYGINNSEFNGLGGQAVGSWTACTISEAAYGALDHPMNSLEISPLVKLKKLLECGKGTAVQAALLFFSKRLEGWRYGCEYGALEVQNHLERVLFSELVTAVMIFYHGGDVQRKKFSPWITHFHVNKERMIRKRLKVEYIIDKVGQYYNSMREKMDVELPRLHFMIKDCPSAEKQKGHDGTLCITVAAETSGPLVQLTTIKNLLIPLILGTLIKGFWEFEKVEILCDSLPGSSDELFLRVTTSNICLPGIFWNTLLNACIPIMDLIDWQRSYPDNVYRILTAYGIDSAWKYFLRSLKLTTAEIGRNVLREHLLLVADCLSVTGEFHGLSAGGLKQQRKQTSISSPFNQACFSGPGNCFITAAKQGLTDHLFGTLDAVAWGKEAPVGTGGPFEIKYAGKVHNQKRRESIYETLCTLNVEEPSLKVHKPDNQAIPAKLKGRPMLHVTEEKIHPLTSGKNSKQERCLLKGLSFKGHPNRQSAPTNGHTEPNGQRLSFFSSESLTHIVNMCTTFRRILHKYPMNGCLDDKDKSFVKEAIIYHPKRDKKLGAGLQDIKVGHSPAHPGSRCFCLVRIDGTTVDFSYRKCVIGAAKQISPELASIVEKKLYHS